MTLALLAMNYCLSYRKAVIILNSGNILKKKSYIYDSYWESDQI